MKLKTLSLLLCALTAACAVDPPELDTIGALSTKPESWKLDNFDQARPFERSDPALYGAAIDAVVAAKGTCREVDADNRCSSIDPIADADTDRAAKSALHCTKSHRCYRRMDDPDGDSPEVCVTTTICCLEVFGVTVCAERRVSM